MTNGQLANAIWAVGVATLVVPMLYAAIAIEGRFRR